MADEIVNAVPPRPPSGEIVSQRALLNTQFALYRNTLAFGGVKDPSMIWSAMLRDDGAAMLYYRELEEKDVDVANALDTLKESALERDWTIEPADKDNTQAVEVAQFVEEQLSHIQDLDGTLDNMLDAMGYGFSIQEMLFDSSEGQAELVGINDCPQELFLFNDRFTPQIGPLQFLDSPYASRGTPVPEEKFLIFSYRGRSRNRMGRPLLRSVFWSSWFKRNMLRLWAQYAEKGPGTSVVRYNDSDSVEEQQKAADLALALIEQVAVAVPQNFDYDKELLQIARTMNPDVHEHFFKAMQLDIVRRILGETLTSFGGEDGKGTQALGDVHAGTLATKSVRSCKMLQSVLNWQLIRPLVLWNFGPSAPMPKWQYAIKQEEDLAERIGIDTDVYEMGVPIPVSYIQNKYQIPAPVDGEPVLTKPVNVAPAVTVRDTAAATFAEGRLAQWWRDKVEGTGVSPTFAETYAAAQAEREMSQFDQLVRQLQDDSLGLLKDRTQEIVNVLEKTEGR